VISGVSEGFINNRFSLEDCHPNPANEFTIINFKINSTNLVDLVLKDNQGRKLKNILHEERAEGSHSVRVDVTDLPTGIYFYSLKTGFFQDTKKLIVTR
jgi:hypothetical protein